MSKPQYEVVSVVEFARRVGCAQSTAREYLEKGKLHGPALHTAAGKKTKLLYEIAKEQFIEARQSAELRFANSNHVLARGKSEPESAAPTPGKLSGRAAIQMDNFMRLAEVVNDPAQRAAYIAQHRAGEFDLPPGQALDMLLAENPAPAGEVYKARTLAELEADPSKVTVYSRHAPPMIMDRELAERMKLRTEPYGDEDEDEGQRSQYDEDAPKKKRRALPDAEPTGQQNPLVAVARPLTQEELAQLSPGELTKRENVLRVLERQVDLEKKLGDVIRREDVYTSLFSFAQEIRSSIEAVPERIADALYAATSRNELFLLLQSELNAALTRLADSGNVELNASRKGGTRAAR